VVNSRLSQTVTSVEPLEALAREGYKVSTQASVHVKVDTGMGRIGVKPEDIVSFIRKVKSFKSLSLDGLFSHFSSADEKDKTFSKRQLQLFEQAIYEIQLAGMELPKKHMANSAAVLDIPESYYDMVRPGIMIYGLYPSEEVSRSIELEPAMILKTKVSAVKMVPGGIPIGYGRTFITKGKTVVATLPVGYGDGYKRLLSNRGEVLIRGCRAPIIGRVCMDMCMVDISDVEGVQPGDEVILFGEDITTEEVAASADTIVNELVCTVGKRVPRVYTS